MAPPVEDALVDLSRLQFASTTLFHYLFVPLTLGLGPFVAYVETKWYRTRDERFLRLSMFLGTLLIINFAMGVVTGIVQEFQFGMNWANFSRLVGDVFGAPLALEGMLAFFLESTFIGLWLFGRDRLPRPVHLATIWLFVLGTWLGAFFIIAANSWMQHPVGYVMDEATGRAQMTDIGAILFQDVTLWSVAHALLGGLIAAAMLVFAIAAYHLRRRQHEDTMRFLWKMAITVGIVATLGQAVVGDTLGAVMVQKQPMKMAAAEALWETEESCAGLSLVAIPVPSQERNAFAITVPCALSLLATNSLDGSVTGIKELQAQAQAEFGPGDYAPNVWIAFYAFRAMIGFGLIGGAWLAFAAWRTRGGRMPTSRWFWGISIWLVLTPWLGNLFGWIFTENGRQPWVVYGELKTVDAVSNLTPGLVLASLIGFVLLYGLLAVIEVRLLLRIIRRGPTAPTDARIDHFVRHLTAR